MKIISELENVDKKAVFVKDKWEKSTGYGITAVLAGGDVWEKAAVSTTIANGILSPERAASISSKGRAAVAGDSYSAAALSMVLHSRSPMVPTFRADIRCFELSDGATAWFGGGGDLTPYYLFDEDAVFFHQQYKSTCDKYSPALYPSFKDWCDRYFYLPARGEHRGVGGIFFDDLDTISDSRDTSSRSSSSVNGSSSPPSVVNEGTIDQAMAFTMDVCSTFMPSYLPIVHARKNLPYSEEQRHFQLLRRGRYVEFNMLYDRGVRFGLVPGGRTEAVLVSCPPLVAWDYNHVPVAGSEEERLMDILKHPKQWL
eukprot:gene6882-13958_t